MLAKRNANGHDRNDSTREGKSVLGTVHNGPGPASVSISVIRLMPTSS